MLGRPRPAAAAPAAQVLRVANTGSQPLEFTCALHTYFRVSGEKEGQGMGCPPVVLATPVLPSRLLQ